MKVFPAADLFPMLPDDELQQLAEDIKAHGLREPIVVAVIDGEEMLVAGRNRLAACKIAGVEPTAAHRALAAFERALPGEASFLIVTQNVDGLHQRAGSQRVCEYHGTLTRWRCEGCGVELEPPDGDVPAHCGELMRPSAVMFGELIPPAAERAAKHALRDCDLFVAIGTSGTVWPAASFVRWAELNGARRILVNLEIDDEAREVYGECHAGTADDLVGKLFAA
jgi:NAD-dependent deacetylase